MLFKVYMSDFHPVNVALRDMNAYRKLEKNVSKYCILVSSNHSHKEKMHQNNLQIEKIYKLHVVILI